MNNFLTGVRDSLTGTRLEYSSWPSKVLNVRNIHCHPLCGCGNQRWPGRRIQGQLYLISSFLLRNSPKCCRPLIIHEEPRSPGHSMAYEKDWVDRLTPTPKIFFISAKLKLGLACQWFEPCQKRRWPSFFVSLYTFSTGEQFQLGVSSIASLLAINLHG